MSAPSVPPISARTDRSNGEFEHPVDVKTAARFLGVSASLVYAYVERKQIPHFRMMGRAIRFRLSELDAWRQQFHVNGGING
jgi:excisionase family DNA binding protein